ncbi:MAG: type II toxin-antitoxin system HicB family antitoxin [Hyphomicrobiales bacterium]|nr:type II toxin-antitoxin system HicB family antitoxin [Hyphomicrobiales bacterium]
MHYVGILDGRGGVWGVRIPDLPGVHGGGRSPEEAIADAISAAREWVAHTTAKSLSVPTARDLAEVLASGEVETGEATVMVPVILDAGRTVKANVTFDAGLLAAIDEEAKARGVTRAAFLASAARAKIETRR